MLVENGTERAAVQGIRDKNRESRLAASPTAVGTWPQDGSGECGLSIGARLVRHTLTFDNSYPEYCRTSRHRYRTADR